MKNPAGYPALADRDAWLDHHTDVTGEEYKYACRAYGMIDADDVPEIRTELNVVEYTTKAGVGKSITAEGAIFAGGIALSALKDDVLVVAFNKALNGKYRAASDILGALFPKTLRDFEGLFHEAPWASKKTMRSFLDALDLAVPGKSGAWTKKQVAGRQFLTTLRNVPSLKIEYENLPMVQDVTANA